MDIARWLPRKRLYLVIGDDEVAEAIRTKTRRRDRCEVPARTWFVRSRRTTATKVAAQLGIGPKASGLVVTAEFYAGFAASDVIETLNVWNREER